MRFDAALKAAAAPTCAILLASAAPVPLLPPGAGGYIHSGLHLNHYRATAFDLNGDGKPELLVYADDPDFCGSGGCNLYVLARTRAGWRTVTGITIIRPPISVLSTSSHGWRDLSARVAGGGIVRAYQARLRFNGNSYPHNPTVWPATQLKHPGGSVVMN